jgi:GTPase SAR1 family protein
MAEIYDEIFKSTIFPIIVILVGDASVGKTNIVSRIVKSN